MNKKKFVNDVLLKYPQLENVGGYFYLKPIDHILSGFHCEVTTTRAYIWRFVFPLFKNSEITLSFSNRLKGGQGFINFDVSPKKNLAEEFCKRIEAEIGQAKSLLNLNKFIHYLESDDVSLDNHHIKKCYASALVLNDQVNEAEAILKELLQTETAMENKTFRTEVDQLLRALQNNLFDAKSLLEQWEKETKILLGI